MKKLHKMFGTDNFGSLLGNIDCCGLTLFDKEESSVNGSMPRRSLKLEAYVTLLTQIASAILTTRFQSSFAGGPSWSRQG